MWDSSHTHIHHTIKQIGASHVRVHFNTGYCITLLHNKDVALKGFLLERKSTRLNHVVFDVLILCFPFRIHSSIYNMV